MTPSKGWIRYFALASLLGLVLATAARAASSVSTAVGGNCRYTPSDHTFWYALCSAYDVGANEAVYDANIMVYEGDDGSGNPGWVEYDGISGTGHNVLDTTLTNSPGRFMTGWNYNAQLADPHHHHITSPGTGGTWIKVRTYFSVNGTPSYYLDSNTLWRGCEVP